MEDVKQCSVSTCGIKATSLGFCGPHYSRFYRHGDPLKGKASRRQTPTKCPVDGCEEMVSVNGLCFLHNRRVKKNGHPGPAKALTKRYAYGERVNSNGYVMVPDPDYKLRPLSKGGHVKRDIAQHRLVMEQYLGRWLAPSENVHHINGNKTDNRLENLELWSESQPAGQRVVDKIAWAKEILSMYEQDLDKLAPISTD